MYDYFTYSYHALNYNHFFDEITICDKSVILALHFLNYVSCKYGRGGK